MKNTQNIILFLMFTAIQTVWSQTGMNDIDMAFEKAFNYHYVDRDSAYFWYERTIDLAREQKDLESELVGTSYLINANNHYYDLENYRRNILRADSLVNGHLNIDTLAMGHYFKDNLLFEKGTYHYKLRDYTAARTWFLKYYDKLRALPEKEMNAFDIDMMSAIYSYLGLIYRHTGRYEQAEFYYKKDIEWVQSKKDSLEEWQSTLFNTQKLLSQVYEIQNKTSRANELLSEALKFYRSKADDPYYTNNYVSTSILLSKNYLKQSDFDTAMKVLDRNILQRSHDNLFLKEIEVIYGDAFLGKKEYAKALRSYEKALRSYGKYRNNNPHQDIAMVYGKIAELYLRQENYTEGLKTLNKAFENTGSSSKTLGSTPDPNKVFSRIQLLHLLDIKLQLLQGKYEQMANASIQEDLLTTINALIETFDLLKSEFDSKLDKQFLAEKAYPIFHRMMETAYFAYQLNGSSETLQLALDIAEKNKDFILLEALRSAQADRYGNVPQKVLDREAQLRAEITHIEKRIFDATENVAGFSDELFQLKQEYFDLLDTLKAKYPKYHRLKYGNTPLNLATIRARLLNDNGTLISYTLTSKFLYAIVLSGSGKNFVKLPFAEVDREAIGRYYELLSEPSIEGVEDIIGLSKNLYGKILKKPLEGFDSENLTIIPDGELHYLPFDLLWSQDAYLLESKRIGYGNSIASLMELKEKKSAKTNKVLAFAPSFSDAIATNSDRQFGRLMYNDNEVGKIGSYFDTETALGNRATLSNFRMKTSGFNLFHFATHASANDEYPDYSYLAFTETKDSTDSNILYIKDLYNTSLNADMVTLSACQTGIGKLQKGQGMLSLSKGFYYAGAKSLVNTLWKINDKSTVRLMENFYQGLSEGKSKTEALRDAKLNYLETVDDELLKHPYYWAAFVVSGDASPINTSHSGSYWIAGILAMALLVFILMNRKTFFQRDRKGFKIPVIGRR